MPHQQDPAAAGQRPSTKSRSSINSHQRTQKKKCSSQQMNMKNTEVKTR